jgi:hypothetical protein
VESGLESAVEDSGRCREFWNLNLEYFFVLRVKLRGCSSTPEQDMKIYTS